MTDQVTTTGAARQSLPAIIVADEGGLRRLAELLAPYMPAPAAPADRTGG